MAQATTVKEIKVKHGKYQKDGQWKDHYKSVGKLKKDDQGREFIDLDPTFNPAGIDRSYTSNNQLKFASTVRLYLFDPYQQGQQGGQQGGYQNQQQSYQQQPAQQAPSQGGVQGGGSQGFDDSIPF